MVTDPPLSQDVVALAGIFQAVALVKQVARSGEPDSTAFEASIGSVFRLEAESAADVFGGVSGLLLGLRTMSENLDRSKGTPDSEITGYVIALMFLERKLVRAPAMLDTLRQEILALKPLRERSPLGPELLASLAQVYTETISRLNPRILVHGVPELLNDKGTANKIRALLLAGMRSTVLWRQVGGGRL
ncbi:MAG: high frequency lysogenization protein HflD, partial [Gammaproteobacteria bacterium]|nr:high frequency lysogenization protein HflD [Gammaproteobacteria bacterium]